MTDNPLRGETNKGHFKTEFLYRKTCKRCFKHKAMVGGGTTGDGKRWYCADCLAAKRAKEAAA